MTKITPRDEVVKRMAEAVSAQVEETLKRINVELSAATAFPVWVAVAPKKEITGFKDDTVFNDDGGRVSNEVLRLLREAGYVAQLTRHPLKEVYSYKIEVQ